MYSVNDINVVVLAAGKSTRIRAVSAGLPKPLIPVQGVPILVRNLRWLASEGVRKVWINLHYRGEEVQREIGDGAKVGLCVSYSIEPVILGTAGAVKKLECQLGKHILVVYGDSLVRLNLAALLADHEKGGAEATIAVFDRDRHLHSGIAGGRVMLDSNRFVAGFVEGDGNNRTGPPFVNAGVYLLNASVLSLIEAGKFVDFGEEIFPKMIAQNRMIRGWLINDDGYCLGLDTPESFERGSEIIGSGKVTLS